MYRTISQKRERERCWAKEKSNHPSSKSLIHSSFVIESYWFSNNNHHFFSCVCLFHVDFFLWFLCVLGHLSIFVSPFQYFRSFKMPVLTSSTSSPSRRLGGSYTSYSSSYGGSSYSRSSSTFSSSSNTAGRTSSLDRSPYSSSYVTSSYKYTSPSSVSVSTRDYSVSSRPPISTRTTTSSLYR